VNPPPLDPVAFTLAATHDQPVSGCARCGGAMYADGPPQRHAGILWFTAICENCGLFAGWPDGRSRNVSPAPPRQAEAEPPADGPPPPGWATAPDEPQLPIPDGPL
jgi:hypothetical protein